MARNASRQQSQPRWFNLCLTAIAPASWGTTYAVATELLPSGHPLLVSALRALPVGLLLISVFRQLPKGHWWWRIFILGGLNITVFQALLFVAAYRLPGGVAATAGAIQPLIVVFLTWLVLNQKPATLSFAAAIAGCIGVGFLVLDPSARLDGIGIVAAIIGAFSMGLGTILVKRWTPSVSLIVFTAWQLTVGGLMLLPMALIIEGPFEQISVTNILGFLYLGLIGTGLAYILWFRGIQKLTATAVAYLGLLSPVVASLVGYVFLKQTFTHLQFLGVAIILTSVLIGQNENSR
ncbi:MAG: EamA family transporter [Cyanobacteria bacterium J06633_2]